MPSPFRVTVVRKSGRKFLTLRCRDSFTGVETTRSSGTTIQREAERAAALWEAELRKQRDANPDEISWAEFVDRYRDEHLQSLARGTMKHALSVLGLFRRSVNPSRLSDVSSQMVSKFAADRRASGNSESTTSSDLAHVRAALRWAKDVGMLREAPHFPRVRRAKVGGKARPMKGRPVTESELELMIAATPEVTTLERATEWQRYIRGLWASGLRLSESLELWWDRDDRLSVDFSHEHPMFRVSAESEKANRDRFLPMAPEFAQFLSEIPANERKGRVFNLPMYRGNRHGRPSHWRVSEILSAIGKAAGVVVDSKGPKYASAHDLRRSFGSRWARRVMPQVLMQLMRHESIETTMRYYVDLDAQETTRDLYAAIAVPRIDKRGDTLGDTGKSSHANIDRKSNYSDK